MNLTNIANGVCVKYLIEITIHRGIIPTNNLCPYATSLPCHIISGRKLAAKYNDKYTLSSICLPSGKNFVKNKNTATKTIGVE